MGVDGVACDFLPRDGKMPSQGGSIGAQVGGRDSGTERITFGFIGIVILYLNCSKQA